MKCIVLAAAALLAGTFALPAAAGDVSIQVGLGWPAAVVHYRDGYRHHYHHHRPYYGHAYYDPYARPVVVYHEIRDHRHRGYRGRGHDRGHHGRDDHHDHYCRH